MEKKKVEIYTDGACNRNPGSGGYGVVMLHGGKRKEMSGGFSLTTNNRMELLAAIVGLEALKYSCEVTLYSDSEYLVNAMTLGWAKKWRRNGWRRNEEEKAKNADLWERLLQLCDNHDVRFIWVKGHAGHRENERCDELARIAAAKPDLPVDEGYDPLQNSVPVEKITQEGQPCRVCQTPVIKKTPNPNRKFNENQKYVYEYYLFCPNCKNMYFTEEAKRILNKTETSIDGLNEELFK
jgi:ribonuclease HI